MSKDNAQEFIEAVNMEENLTLEELLEIVKEPMLFSNVLDQLVLLFTKKGLDIHDLCSSSEKHLLPADRIT